MKKRLMLILLLFFGFSIKNVFAESKYLVTDENGEYKRVSIDGHAPEIVDASWDYDGNIVLLVRYQDNKSKWKDNNYVIPGNSSPGVFVEKRVKFVMVDQELNKVFESDYWANGESQSDITSFTKLTKLTDGTFLAVGTKPGTGQPDFIISRPSSLIARFDKDGKVIYEYSYDNSGLETAYYVAALSNGGYLVAHYYQPENKSVFSQGFVEPSEFKIDNHDSKFQYVIYDSNNNIVENFSDHSSIEKYDFMSNTVIEDLTKIEASSFNTEGEVHSVYVPDEYHGSLGVKDGMSYYASRNIYNGISIDHIEVYPENEVWDIKKTISILGISKDQHTIKVNESIDQKLFDNGELFKLNDNEDLGYIYFHRSNENEYADFIINGKKVEYGLDSFIENDRTYVNLNDICILMDCTYSRGSKNPNELIIQFDIFNDNKMVNYYESSNNSIGKRVKYTIVHQIGSKEYTTYLSFQPLKIFRLKSPIYDVNKVDVASIEKNNEIYIPLRFISEALGRYVSYEPKGDNPKPIITIGAYGEGEFYDKYGVAISYSDLNNGDQLSGVINSNNLELEWGLKKLVYAYGYNKAENKVVSLDKTIFVPTQDKLLLGGHWLNYNNLDDSNIKNHYEWLIFESKDNWIGKQEAYKDDNGKEGDKYYGSGEYESFMVVSNIEGYPFIKIVNFK